MGGFYFKMKSELKNMNVVKTSEVAPNVFAIKDSYVNMFLVKDIDNYIAIDAGSKIETIGNEMKTLHIHPENVVAVILTHTDGDHVAALQLFKNATVYLSKVEEQMINGKRAKMMFFHNKMSTTKYTLLDDQQIIKIGNVSLKAIMTPGHTPGSMSYVVNYKYLFVGDAFGIKNGKIEKPNQFFSSDMKTALLSFKKINDLQGVEYIFTAHNGFTNDYKNAVKTILK
jgi:glyoxylase-like metal-dependent hydrolase (beta-lactamase superfamily II)